MASTHRNAKGELCCDWCGLPVADEPEKARRLLRALAIILITLAILLGVPWLVTWADAATRPALGDFEGERE